MTTLQERFHKVYAILPEMEKDNVIAIHGGRRLTWREINNMIRYSESALKKMEELKVI